MAYPSNEVSNKTILRHVILPGGVRLLTWNAGDIDHQDIKLGYAIYRKGVTTPIFQGYLHCDNRQTKSDAALLEILGLILCSAWSCTMYSHDMEEFASEYTEEQINWLQGPEILALFALLGDYEDEAIEDVEENKRQFYWKDGRLYNRSSPRPVIADINVN